MRGFAIFLIAFFGCRIAAAAGNAWEVGVTDGGSTFVAGVSNDSGGALVQFCVLSEGNCYWALVISQACTPGDNYPILGNSDAGSAALQIYCGDKTQEGLYRYVFADFDQIDLVVRKGSKVGFAMATDGAKFVVVRFELAGSVRALDSMRKNFLDEFGHGKGADTKDRMM